MRRLVPVTALLGLLAVAPVADAASTVVVRGRGFGHGIGMSQYGAYGYAQKGVPWQRILTSYYTNTGLGTAPPREIRVLLQASVGRVLVRGASRAPGGRRLDPAKTYSFTRAGPGRVRMSGVGVFRAPLRVYRAGGVVRLGGRAINGVSSGLYRGRIELRPGASGGVTAVNSLPVDLYARGVVAGEMPSEWAMDALRAQAVAARTYGLATRQRGGVFDQYPDTRSQVYLGVKGETARTNSAVRDTAGKIVTYRGKIATTYFFSTSGGRTENIENSFIGSEPEPWLKSVADPYDSISPRASWRLRFSAASLGARLGVPGSYRKVAVLERGVSPRIVRARVYGSRGSRVLTGPQIRARLGLYDTWAYFTSVSSSQVGGPPSGARAASARRLIRGSFDPAPRARRLTLERRSGRSWRRVATIRTDRRGRFTAAVGGPGTYRVRGGEIAGPPTRVR